MGRIAVGLRPAVDFAFFCSIPDGRASREAGRARSGRIGKTGELKSVDSRYSSWIEAHHLIPVELLDMPAVQAALEGGFRFNGLENGAAVIGRHGPNPGYSNRIRQMIEEIQEKFPDATPDEFADMLRQLAADEAEDIVENGQRLWD